MDRPMTREAADAARARLLARAEDLYRDPTFAAVKEWKARAPGRAAIGYLPPFAPKELIDAAEMLAVGVYGGGDMEVVKGDSYFQSYICHLPRSTIELGLSGALDCLDGMLFPSVCDVVRNLSGMWQVLFPKRFVHYLDLPQNFDPATGGAFFVQDLRVLLDHLGKIRGRAVTDDELRAAILRGNANRRLVAELYALRARAPWQVPSSELYLLLRAGCVLPIEEHSAMLGEYLAAVSAAPARPKDMARVAIRGCFCEQPPLELIRTLERSGCFLVDDDWLLSARWIDGDVEVAPDQDPLTALVSAFLARAPACPSLHDPDAKRGERLVERVRSVGAEGVIFAAPSFCDPALLEQPMTMGAVKCAGLPCTAFQFSESTGQFQVIREQSGTFADSIRLA